MAETQDIISKAHLTTGRAVDSLRRQLAIVFEDDSGMALGACPLEGMTAGLLANLQTLPKMRLSLLITSTRAHHVGLNIGEAKVVRIDAQGLSLAQMLALADPLAESKDKPKIHLLPATSSQEMLMTLAKYAALLPALVLIESSVLPKDWLRVSAADIAAYWAAPPLDMVPLTEARLPMAGAEEAKIICFRQRYGTSVHLALVIGDTGDNPLARIHSSCVTGDILGSLRCDCGDQLKLALAEISRAGAGILIYLHQEGRGIGIANKLRAYQLQERGIDTYEANAMLGFEEDERDFAIAGAILKKLHVKKIRMLTNNPHKMAAIEKAGINVTERVPLIAETGEHNRSYIDAKGKKAGHLF